MNGSCDTLKFLQEFIFAPSVSQDQSLTNFSVSDRINNRNSKWLIFYLTENLNSSVKSSMPTKLENNTSLHIAPFDSSFKIIFPSNEENHCSKTKDTSCEKFIIACRRIEENISPSLLQVHLVRFSSVGLNCVSEFEVEDCLDQFIEVVWKIHRKLFYYTGRNNLSHTLQLCIFNEPNFCHLLSSQYFGIAYVITVLAFSFPTSNWLSFWPWDSNRSIKEATITFSHLITSLHNKEELVTFTSILWFYFVPFLVERLRSLEGFCDPVDFFPQLDRFESINCASSQITPTTTENPLIYFLTGFKDLSAFSDPIFLKILEKKILPYASDAHFNALATSVSSDLLVRILQNFSMCRLMADYRPDFIIKLLEDSTVLRENFQSLYLIANHEGDANITSWMHFILNIYLDCVAQIFPLELQACNVMNRITRTFSLFEPLRQTIDMELQKFERLFNISRSDLRFLAKLVLRGALRAQLSHLSSNFVSLSYYISQLTIPVQQKLYITVPGISSFL